MIPSDAAAPPARTAGRIAALLAPAALLAGCAASEVLDRHGIEIYKRTASVTTNVIDRALATCPEKLPKPETACVKQGLAEARTGTAELIGLVPGCRAGRICTYDFTTRDRLGFVPATASTFVVNWRVSFDLRPPGVSVADMTVKVENRDDYTASPPPAPLGPPGPPKPPATPTP